MSFDPDEKRKLMFKFVGQILKASVYVISAILVINAYYNWYNNNEACDRKCIEQGYPAGEEIPWMKHTACVCFPEKAGTPAYFLLERDD
jgi:hypothetical protein